MAMKKAEMQAHAEAYRARMNLAEHAERRGMYREAISAAVSAWEHIDGMMQYERRYQDAEFTEIPAIDFALRYAPLLLDMNLLNELERLLTSYRRIRKNAAVDWDSKLRQSRVEVWENHCLWSYLERHPATEQTELPKLIGGEARRWDTVAEAWGRMGLLAQTRSGNSSKLSLTTRMGEVMRGKCPLCGHIDMAPKAMLLEALTCPGCQSSVVFVLLPRQ